MPQIRNVSTDALDVNVFDLHVEPGETIDVPDDIAEALAGNPNFKIVPAPKAPKAEKESE